LGEVGVMKTMVVVLASLLAVALPDMSTAQDLSPAEYMARIEGTQEAPGENGLGSMTLQELLEHFKVPGVSVAVIRNFRVHWAKGYGVADVETGDRVDTETMFQAASISKPVQPVVVSRRAHASSQIDPTTQVPATSREMSVRVYNGARRRGNREASSEGERHAEPESIPGARASGDRDNGGRRDAHR
ncbi:MAG: serine hydrolase domain-containing protein, partial [Vicinamibacterales bacterium]